MSPTTWMKEWLKRRLGVPSIERSLESLARRGFLPRIVFDVGAYHGEFALTCRRLFRPAPRLYCFEPLPSALTVLTRLQQQGEIMLIPTLVGAEDRESVMFHEMETASSVLPEHHQPAAQSISHLRMIRLDTFLASSESPGSPDLLKIDTQGYEMEVLKGIENNLTQVRAILAEINFLDIHQGVALASEVFDWLGRRDYVPYDISSLIRRPLDGSLWQADFIFLKRDDPFRSDKRWG